MIDRLKKYNIKNGINLCHIPRLGTNDFYFIEKLIFHCFIDHAIVLVVFALLIKMDADFLLMNDLLFLMKNGNSIENN